MANAKKCDRCGAYYDKNEYKMTSPSGQIIHSPTYITVHCMNDAYRGYCDLCDVCWDDFNKFIVGTPIVSEEEEE